MEITTLASSSEGNCTKIWVCGTTILIDCGISKKRIFADGEFDVDAVFITHDHSDHISGVNVLYKKTGCTIYVHQHVVESRPHRFDAVAPEDLVYIQPGQTIRLGKLDGGKLDITGFSTKHDSAYSMGFVIEESRYGGKKLGYLTDTGMITRSIQKALEGCNAYFIEADYEENELIKYADYSIELKDRIRGNFGHLSNSQAVDFISKNVNMELVEFVIFGHLSPRTNSPKILTKHLEESFPNYVNKFKIAPMEGSLTL